MTEEITIIITGVFTLLGVVIGTVTEWVREKWKHNIEEKEREQKRKDEINTIFLSPLCYHFQQVMLFFNLDLQKVDSWKEFLERLETVDSEFLHVELSRMEEVMEPNIVYLSQPFYFDITWMISSLKIFSNFLNETRDSIKKEGKKRQLQKKDQEVKAIVEEIVDMQRLFSDLVTEITAAIYVLLKVGFGDAPDENIINEDAREKLQRYVRNTKNMMQKLGL